MVNQLKKDLPESQKSPFPLQTDVIPHHSRQRLPHPAISERAWFHPSSSKPYRSLNSFNGRGTEHSTSRTYT